MSSLLTAQGYTVLQASSGAKALEAARRARNKVDLLIAEVVLSDGLDGRELAERIRKNRPKLKVVFASGFDRSVIGKEFMQRGQQFLQKPYDLEKLAEAVRASLDRAR
jgi:DNA-binding response OmpR family regulator